MRCGLHTRTVTVCRDRYPKASDISSPPCLLRSLPAGANRRVGRAPTGKAPPCHGARGLRAFPICLAWGAHALQADLRTSAARIASDGLHSCQQVQVRIQFERLDESGFGLTGDPKQGERTYCCRGATGRRWVFTIKGSRNGDRCRELAAAARSWAIRAGVPRQRSRRRRSAGPDG